MIFCFLSFLLGSVIDVPTLVPQKDSETFVTDSGSFFKGDPSTQRTYEKFVKSNHELYATLRRTGFMGSVIEEKSGPVEVFGFANEGSSKVAEYAAMMSTALSRATFINNVVGWGSSGMATLLVFLLSMQQQSQYADPTAIYYWGVPGMFFAVLGSFGSKMLADYFQSKANHHKGNIAAVLDGCNKLLSFSCGNLPPDVYVLSLLAPLISAKPGLYRFGHETELVKTLKTQVQTDADQSKFPYFPEINLVKHHALVEKYDKAFVRYQSYLQRTAVILLVTGLLTIAAQITSVVYNVQEADAQTSQGNRTTPNIFDNRVSTTPPAIINFISTGLTALNFLVFGLYTKWRSNKKEADKKARNVYKIVDYVEAVSPPTAAKIPSIVGESREPVSFNNDGDNYSARAAANELPSSRYRPRSRVSSADTAEYSGSPGRQAAALI